MLTVVITYRELKVSDVAVLRRVINILREDPLDEERCLPAST
jgi:hypothetical protein